MKHAYLVIAHNEFGILQMLVSALDSRDNDFYIHYDKKVKNLPSIVSQFSSVHILSERIDVRWGSVSQIKTELLLLEYAETHGTYDYYHIISGVHLPLKPLSEIDSFFESVNGKNVLCDLCKAPEYEETLKMRRYNLFLRNYASKRQFLSRVSQFLWKSFIAVQRILGIESNKGCIFYKASNWLSLTDEAVKFLLSEKQSILKKYKYSFCGDEFFVPTELMDSPLKDTVYNYPEYLKYNMLRANAEVFPLSKLGEFQNSGYLFARKFSSQ